MPEIGKIYEKSEAEKLYGEVFSSYPLTKIQFIDILSKTEQFIMFQLLGNDLFIKNNKKEIIFESSKAEYMEVFNLFSISFIRQIIDSTKEEIINVELRKNNILTISNETFVLEDSVQCPPFCYNS